MLAIQAKAIRAETLIIAADATKKDFFAFLSGTKGLTGKGSSRSTFLGDASHASLGPKGFLRRTVFVEEQFFVPLEIPQ